MQSDGITGFIGVLHLIFYKADRTPVIGNNSSKDLMNKQDS